MHPSAIFAPVGGTRATIDDLDRLRQEVVLIATRSGFPDTTDSNARVQFDRAAAAALPTMMVMNWNEASAIDVWSHIALVVVPDVTEWRFEGSANKERWIGPDLVRHAWARLWWQGTVFEGHFDLLEQLSESDLNQLLERRSIGGDRRLLIGIAEAIVQSAGNLSRRSLVRDAARRLRRELSYLDPHSLDDAQIRELCTRVVAASI